MPTPQQFGKFATSTLSCRLGMDDRFLERSLANAGCEVHCFDPGLKQPHAQQDEMWLHRLSVDWRDPNPGLGPQRQHSSTKKLATIMNNFGHRQVRNTHGLMSLSLQAEINQDYSKMKVKVRIMDSFHHHHHLPHVVAYIFDWYISK